MQPGDCPHPRVGCRVRPILRMGGYAIVPIATALAPNAASGQEQQKGSLTAPFPGMMMSTAYSGSVTVRVCPSALATKVSAYQLTKFTTPNS